MWLFLFLVAFFVWFSYEIIKEQRECEKLGIKNEWHYEPTDLTKIEPLYFDCRSISH